MAKAVTLLLGSRARRVRNLIVDYFDAPADDFRLRAEAALTHPATLLALAALLVNDHLLKSIWPGAWATGKLSDLAWLIFAMPLAAWLLSLIARDGRLSRRVAFISAYLGLPLLYAAFNTFGSLHDFILTAITTPFGLIPGSPLDATDSIVIPPAMAIGLWVWRANSAKSALARRKWVAAVASIAVVSSIATSPAPVENGITYLGVADNGTIVAVADSEYWSERFESSDGGMTWNLDDSAETRYFGGGDRVQTPRGIYVIDGPDILRAGMDGMGELVYSAAYLQQSHNAWLQRISTVGLGERELSEQPLAIAYDPTSGNLVVAMGIQGVLIGTPDEQWIPVAVGPFRPTDFSLLSKARYLLASLEFWTASFLLSLAMVGVALMMANRTMESLKSLPVELAVGAGSVTTFVAMVWISLDEVQNLLAGLASLGFVIMLVIAVYAKIRPPESVFRRLTTTTFVGLTLGLSVAILLIFQNFDEAGLWLLLAIPAFMLNVPMFALTWDRSAYLRTAIPFFLLMNVLVFLPHMLWLNAAVEKVVASLLAVLLTTIVAVAMAVYLRPKIALMNHPQESSPVEPKQGL